MFGVKFFIALPFVYHMLIGVRHLVWDTGKGLQLSQLYKSGYLIICLAVIGASVLATL